MTESRINRALDVALEDLDVVVVDDSKPMQTIVRSMLNAARVHRVRTFDHAGEAYRAMLVEPPHLLITDWNLPDSDGLALVRSLRDPRSGPLVAVPTILITGHATRRLVERAIDTGVHFVLAKPLSPSNVLKRIQAVITDRRAFVLDRTRGYYVLQGAEELLAGQRQRWRDLQEGTPHPVARAPARAASTAATPADAPAAEAAKPGAAAAGAKPPVTAAKREPRSIVSHPNDRRRAFGMAAPLRGGKAETSTGQPRP